MMPEPLHPAIVHFPIALAVLVPLLALLAAIAIRAGWLPARLWLAVVLLQGLLVGSAWVAIETGENEEERVERAVSERRIEVHEEAAERFLGLAGVAWAITALGLLGGSLGTAGRVASIAAAAAVLVAGVSVGHSGGELVYRHGAAQAYVQKAAKRDGALGTALQARSERRREKEDDD